MPRPPLTFDCPVRELPEVRRADRQAWAVVAALLDRRIQVHEHNRSRRWNAEMLHELRAERSALGELWWEVNDIGGGDA